MVYYTVNLLYLFYIKILETTAFVKKRAYQTSTNGSYEAFLGCDGDMDTFSLTAEVNSHWLMKLDKSIRIIWIYVSIRAGKKWFIFFIFKVHVFVY